jgi:Fe-S-cluster-containing dehydrogenase component
VDRITDKTLPEAQRKPACVLACPAGARLFGDIHDPASTVSTAISERAGYPLMPEWGTRPANHYLPRRRTQITLHAEDLQRRDNPLKLDGKQPETPQLEPGREDYAT